MHRIEYVKINVFFQQNENKTFVFQLRQMNKIKKGMIELEETKRINKELLKIIQTQDHERHQQCSSVNFYVSFAFN